MALKDFFEDFIIQSKVYVDTGFGTFEPQYTDGANFRAGISTNSSVEAQIAERNGMKTIYTIVHLPSIALHKDDRVRRIKDGRMYRITSDSADMITPAMADVRYAQVTAEVIS